jgi:thymidylate kinase
MIATTDATRPARPIRRGERCRGPVLITLSGPEGGGKSTALVQIVAMARGRGLSVHTVKADGLTLGGLAAKVRGRRRPRRLSAESIAGRGRPGRRLRDARRGGMYIADALIMRLYLRLPRCRRAGVVVCDRYLYDEMVRIVDRHPRLARLVRGVAPRPDRALILLASAEELAARRARSEPAYYHQRLRQFAAVRALCPELIVVGPGGRVEDAVGDLVRVLQQEGEQR